MSKVDKDKDYVYLNELALNARIERLFRLCAEACEKEDPILFRRALKVLSTIEETLWRYYMEVYKI